jgi:hypothetical protein
MLGLDIFVHTGFTYGPMCTLDANPNHRKWALHETDYNSILIWHTIYSMRILFDVASVCYACFYSTAFFHWHVWSTAKTSSKSRNKLQFSFCNATHQ